MHITYVKLANRRSAMNSNAMFNISYGLYVLTAKDGEKDNGCIVNTLLQVTSTPNAVSITVNKQNYTHDMILKTGKFNVSMLSTSADFELFKRFGFHSGKDVDKFEGFDGAKRSENGIMYVSENVNAYISAEVFQTVDLGTHTTFFANVTDMEVLSDEESLTYAYYHKHVKPQPPKEEKGGWRCKICGYVYEGDPLPEDFVCPLCKHGAEDFEKIQL